MQLERWAHEPAVLQESTDTGVSGSGQTGRLPVPQLTNVLVGIMVLQQGVSLCSLAGLYLGDLTLIRQCSQGDALPKQQHTVACLSLTQLYAYVGGSIFDTQL